MIITETWTAGKWINPQEVLIVGIDDDEDEDGYPSTNEMIIAKLRAALVDINLALGLPPNSRPDRTRQRARLLRFWQEGT